MPAGMPEMLNLTSDPMTVNFDSTRLSGMSVSRERWHMRQRTEGSTEREFDVFDPALAVDPYPTYQWLRTHCPIGRSDKHGGFWILSKYSDIIEACRQPEVFSSNPVGIPANMGQARPMVPLEADPPDHADYRRILAPVFSPSGAAALEGGVRAQATRLIDGFIERGSCDLIADFAAHLPATVFVQFMKWPQEDAPKFLDWARTILAMGAIEESVREQAGAELYAYFDNVISERVDNPTDDFVSYLLNATFGDLRPLSRNEILDIVFNLMGAGMDTTTAALGNAFDYLATHPEQRDQLVADPSLIPNAVEELLRWESLALSGRRVTRDVTVGDIEMRKGDRVMVLYGSASRDEDKFDRADQVDFGRTPNHHLAFGSGPHRCLGSHLARMELRVAMEEIHRRIPDYRLTPGAVVPKQLGFVRGVEHLPLEFTPGPPEAKI
jgi:cytochrome P450